MNLANGGSAAMEMNGSAVVNLASKCDKTAVLAINTEHNMINLRQELYNLCQCADGSLPAVDYLQMLDIHSTLPRENRVALIGELKAIIAAIKELCTDDEVAMFEFYFQRLDLAGQPRCLLRLAKLVYPQNTYDGALIAKKWRGDKFSSAGHARKMIADNEVDSSNQKLSKLLIGFIDLDTVLASDIEELLIKNLKRNHYG
jgi:hypothetical protein